MLTRTDILAAGVLTAWLAAMGATSAAEAQRDGPVQVAALPAPALDGDVARAPFTPIQTQTCGCTPPPNPKQKIIVNSGGRNVCTVTTVACWAP